MNDNEANKIIADFVNDGIDFSETVRCHIRGKTCRWWQDNDTYFTTPCYTKSLDALVPVWEKLEITEMHIWTKFSSFGNSSEIYKSYNEYGSHFVEYENNNASITNNVAHATAKAILELKER